MVGVADRGRFAEAAECGEVEGVWAVDEGFFEVAVHAEPVESDAAVTEQVLEVGIADRLGAVGADRETRRCGLGYRGHRCCRWRSQSGEHLVAEFVEFTSDTSNGEPAAGEVEVGERHHMCGRAPWTATRTRTTRCSSVVARAVMR